MRSTTEEPEAKRTDAPAQPSTRERAPRKMRRGVVRAAVLSALIAIAVISAVFGTGFGTPSSLGIGAVAYLCPLGALESMLGGFAFVPRLLIALAAVVLLALLVGRAFCAWACPVPPLRRFLATKGREEREGREREQAASEAARRYGEGCVPKRPFKGALDSRHVVLCGALGSAAVFGFPVFCLICPIGLTFAIVIGLVRLVGFNEPSFGILLFAGILILELAFLRKWCARFCPVGALLSLAGRANRTFRPHASCEKCLRTAHGQACGACAVACPEHIDPHSDLGERSKAECTRCGRCADACPAGALSFPLLARRGESASGAGKGACDVEER